MQPVVFNPRKKPPTLLNIWIPFLILSGFSLLMAFLTDYVLAVFCVSEITWFTLFVFSKSEIKVVISIEDKFFQYHYLNCWGKEKVIDIDIAAATGDYKYTKISQAKSGWQLILKNDKSCRVIVSQGSFKKFQLDQMVRMINQIKKGIFVANVGNEF